MQPPRKEFVFEVTRTRMLTEVYTAVAGSVTEAEKKAAQAPDNAWRLREQETLTVTASVVS